MTKLQFGGHLRKTLYTDEDIKHFENSKLIAKFIERKAAASIKTAGAYKTALLALSSFLRKQYGQAVDAFIEDMKNGKQDPYDVLSGFAAYLVNSRTKDQKVSANTVRQFVILSKKFARVSGVKSINNDDFKELVTLPRKEQPIKEALEKKDVVEILNACKDIKLRTALLLLASTGGRSAELFSLRVKDVNLEGGYPTVTFRKEYTKTRQARTRPLTREAVLTLQLWLKTKYQPHRTTITDEKRKEKQEYVNPAIGPDDLIFAEWHKDGHQPEPRFLADRFRISFGRLLGMIEKAKLEDNGRRRTITLHSFRRFTKTTISNQGYADYSEWMLGHGSSGIGQTYFKQYQKDSLEIFRKIEPYLTFLDVSQLEAKGADQQTRLDQMQFELQREREERAKLYELLYKQGIIKKE